MSHRRTAAATSLSLVLIAIGYGCREPSPRLPSPAHDVVVILVDCLRADHVGVYGHHRPTTPHLDALAREGVYFEHAFAQSHWTRPSVPTLLTGLYPNEHGLLEVERDGKRIVGPSMADEVEMVSEALQASGYATALLGEQFQLSPTFNLDQGFDLYRHRKNKAPAINRGYLQWLAAQADEQPTFAYLHYLDIHWPYCPTGWAKGRFDSGESDLAICVRWRKLRADIQAGRRKLSSADVERIVARYDEELVQLDDYLGKLFAAMKQLGRWDDTLVIVTADHGEEFFEHDRFGHQDGLWDTLIRVPLIVHPPSSWQVTPRREAEAVVELRSVAPTVREAAGVAPGRGGPSLLPLLFGPPGRGEFEFAVAENSRQIAVRARDRKLVVDRDDGSLRLFDLETDPAETEDVADRDPEAVARLSGHLRRWRANLRPIEPVRGDVDQGTVDGLRDLGYID